MASLFIDTASHQGFGYNCVQSMSPTSLLKKRQPQRWWHDAGSTAPHTARLCSVGKNPLADLRAVKRQLQFKSICLLVEGSQNSPLLYVHSMNPIVEVLDQSCLENLRMERQHVLFFMLRPPYNLNHIEEAMKYWASQRNGINAAVVHTPSDMLVVFANDTSLEPVPECFKVSLAFCGNVCPLVEPPTSDITLWVSGDWASIDELNVITKALVATEQPGIMRIEVDEGWSQLRIRLQSTADIISVREATLSTLRNMGRRAVVKCNKVVLYQCAIPLSPFDAEIDMSVGNQTISPSLRATIAATDAALARQNKDISTEVFAYDVAVHLLNHLNVEAILRHNYKFSFDIQGMKCVECVRLILEELFLDRPGRVGYTHIALSPTRNVLVVNVPAEQRQGVQQHVQESLLALGISATVIGQGPDLEAADDEHAQALYTLLLKKSTTFSGPATALVAVQLRPEALRCASCAALLRSTMLRVVPGIVHISLDCNSGVIVIHYAACEVTETEIVGMLESAGYQPTTFKTPPPARPVSGGSPPQQQQHILPKVSPKSPSLSEPQYFNSGSACPAMRNGQLNPYALTQPAHQPWKDPGTPDILITSGRVAQACASHESLAGQARGYTDTTHQFPSNSGKKHVSVVP